MIIRNFLIFLFSFLFFSNSISVTAQTCNSNAATQKQAKADNSLSIVYSSAENETFADISPLIIAPGEHNFVADRLLITAGFNYKGKLLSEIPKTIRIELFTNTQGKLLFEKEESRSLSIKVEDKLILFGIFNLISSRTSQFTNQMHQQKLEHLGLEIPFEAFKKMLIAEKVVFEVGGKKIKLKENHLKALCNLLSYANSPEN